MFKVFCFESYITANNLSEAEVAGAFVQNVIGTYLETVYNVIKTDNHTNFVLNIDIYQDLIVQSGRAVACCVQRMGESKHSDGCLTARRAAQLRRNTQRTAPHRATCRI